MKKRIFALLFAVVMIAWIIPINVFATESHEHFNDGDGYDALENGQHLHTCSCGEEVIEDCTFGYYTYDETEHWTECDYCWNRIDVQPHTVVDCECTGENCHYATHTVDGWTPATDDSYTHTGFCSSCRRDVEEDHCVEWIYTESEHGLVCECGYEEEGCREEHSFSDWCAHSLNKHFKFCGCGYEVIEFHVDSDNDGFCDIETCGGTVHVNADGDHRCDDCGITLEYLCTDSNEDHVCDVPACGRPIYEECVDENDDHVCDVLVCSRHMMEYCEDENEDYICDICEKNCCNHYVENVTSNGDGTHSGVCLECGSPVTEYCDEDYIFDWGHTEHYNVCYCDYEFPGEAHTYENKWCDTRSIAGHWVMCDVCSMDHYEVHTASNGVCEICGLELVETFDVYVGGVGLKDGQYLDNAGNVTAAKPVGGYAYYKDGVLELNGFVYEGIGVMWQEGEDFESYAPVFASKDLILKLTGENRLSSTAKTEEEDFYLYGDGIAATGNLTVGGEGRLTVLSTDDGINVKDGNFTMESGTLTFGILEYNADGSIKRNEAIGDDGIDVDNGDLSMSGGTVYIHAEDHGMDVSGLITISGGVLKIVAGDDGIEADEAVTISGCKIEIEADDEMIRGSSVTISVVEKEDDSTDRTDGNSDNNGGSDNNGDSDEGEDANSNGGSGSNEDKNSNGDSDDTPDFDNASTDAEPDGLSGGAIAGIAVGSVVVAELGGFSVFWFVIKKKKFADLIRIFKTS